MNVILCSFAHIRFPEFKNLINSYDKVGVQESKLDDLDSVQIPGYETEINTFNTDSKNMILFGDLNSRTASL